MAPLLQLGTALRTNAAKSLYHSSRTVSNAITYDGIVRNWGLYQSNDWSAYGFDKGNQKCGNPDVIGYEVTSDGYVNPIKSTLDCFA